MVATVLEKTVAEDCDDTTIYTYYWLRIDDVLKGNVGQTRLVLLAPPGDGTFRMLVTPDDLLTATFFVHGDSFYQIVPAGEGGYHCRTRYQPGVQTRGD